MNDEPIRGQSPESAWRVQDISRQLGDYLAALSRVWIEGQIVSSKVYGRLVYITLRDPDVEMSMNVVAPVDVFGGVQPPLTDGARVVILANVEWRSKNGSLMLRAHAMKSVGQGELRARLEMLRNALAVEGLFDAAHKKPLPFLPRKVGLITGRDTDALKDVVVNSRRRWPATHFVIKEIPLQQQNTPVLAAAALAELQALDDIDVIVIARGGGSFEDLLPWSDEGLLRAVAAAHKPVVSAIGHENDRPLLDDVADVRASTPTHAASLIVPDLEDEQSQTDRLISRLADRRRRWLDHNVSFIKVSTTALRARSPRAIVSLRVAEMAAARTALREKTQRRITAAQSHTATLLAQLRALSPDAVLQRGFAVVTSSTGEIIKSAAEVTVADSLNITLHHGSLRAVVQSTEVEETS